MSHWPFRTAPTEPRIREPTGFVEKLALRRFHKDLPWVSAMQQLFKHYRAIGATEQASKVASILADALPHLDHPQYVAGLMLLQRRREREGLQFLERAVEQAPGSARNLLALSHALVAVSQTARARRILERLIAANPSQIAARRLLERIDRNAGGAKWQAERRRRWPVERGLAPAPAPPL